MSQTSMDILKRPFSIEPITGVMLPDGIFDTAIYKQKITCHYTNTGASELTNVKIYIEGISDLGIVPEAKTYFFAQIPANAAVQVSWLADFRNGTPGKKNVSFIAKAEGQDLRRSIKQIFVSTTTFDSATSTYTCSVPEGIMHVRLDQLIGTSSRRGKRCDCDREHKDTGPWLIRKVSMEVIPNPPYSGQFGDLPFQDPIWKIVGWVVCVIAAIVAVVAAIVAVIQGTADSEVNISVGGKFDETDPSINDCCKPSYQGTTVGNSKEGAGLVYGVASLIALGGMAVGLADFKDPWQRGQEATIPGPNETTLSETLTAEFDYPQPPQAGKPYIVNVHWIYTRITNVRTYTFEIKENVSNIHLLDHLEVMAPNKITHFGEKFIVKARLFKDVNTTYLGDQLYVFALIVSPSKIGFYLPLTDDGIRADEAANDGTYTAIFDLRDAHRQLLEQQQEINGFWRVYIFAQDISDITPSISPAQASNPIGGFMIASALELSYDTAFPCPFKNSAIVEVII